MVKIHSCVYTSGLLHKILLITIILFGAVQLLIQDLASAVGYGSFNTEVWDRLLIEEVPALRENVDNIISAANEQNHSMVREQIDDIKSSDNWFNMRKDLDARDAANLVSHFNKSLSELEASLGTEDPAIRANKANILQENLDVIVKLSEPVIDANRLILTTSIIGIVIGSGLYIIPKFRKRFNIKY